MFRKILIALFLIVFLSACAQAGGPPAPSDANVPADQPLATPYPGPNDPFSSGNPGAYPAPAVGSGAYPDPLNPQGEDVKTQRGNVFVDSTEILTMESFPPQFMLSIKGHLPTPCHELRYLVHEPDADNRINIEAFSVFNSEEICVPVLESFEENLNLGSFPAGEYTVLLNGEQIGQIMAP